MPLDLHRALMPLLVCAACGRSAPAISLPSAPGARMVPVDEYIAYYDSVLEASRIERPKRAASRKKETKSPAKRKKATARR
jgi:hypothetical protein